MGAGRRMYGPVNQEGKAQVRCPREHLIKHSLNSSPSRALVMLTRSSREQLQ